MRRIRILLLVSLLALVVVPAAWAIRFTDESFNPPVGETGKPYPNWSFTGAGGCGPALPYQFTLLGGSSMPPGLTLDLSGLVHGIPTRAGDYSFWVNLSDENPPSASWCRPSSAQREITMHIIGGLKINQNALSPAAAFLNQPYSFQFTATGPGTWSISSGALPPGITIKSSSGLLSGTPTAVGDYTFKVKLSDGTRTDSQTYTLSIVEPLTIVKPASAAEVGRPYTLELKATGGKPPYKWSLDGGTALPSEFKLDQATGVITGLPSTPGTMPFKVKVTDALGLSTTLEVKLVVAAKLAIVKRLLPGAHVGSAYHARLISTGGVRPRAWSIVGGRLPAGLRLNTATGQISGTPTRAGRSAITVQVADALGGFAKARFVLRVAGA